MPSADGLRRAGSLVPRRLYGNSVGRNGARRRLREHFRTHKDLYPDGAETLVRLYAAPSDWDMLFRELDSLLTIARRKAARLVKEEGRKER